MHRRQQQACENQTNCCDRVWIMSLRAYAATRVVGSAALAPLPVPVILDSPSSVPGGRAEPFFPSLPLLRILTGLSVCIEIDFINAGLLRGARLGVPPVSAQLDLAEFLYS